MGCVQKKKQTNKQKKTKTKTKKQKQKTNKQTNKKNPSQSTLIQRFKKFSFSASGKSIL